MKIKLHFRFNWNSYRDITGLGFDFLSYTNFLNDDKIKVNSLDIIVIRFLKLKLYVNIHWKNKITGI